MKARGVPRAKWTRFLLRVRSRWRTRRRGRQPIDARPPSKNRRLVWRFENSPDRMEGSERIFESPATRPTNDSAVLLEFEVRSEPDPITWRTSNSAQQEKRD
jgi:hypothetical protein